MLLLVIYVVFISLGLPDSLFGVAWPVVHLEFGQPESLASVYSIIIGVCTGGVSFLSGKLIRRFGTGRVTLFSTLLTVVGMVGISFAPNIWVMMFFSIVMGYGAGAIDTGLNSYVSLHYQARHMNWLHCFWGVGVTLSPMIMSAFLGGGTGAWRWGYRTVAAIQLAIAMLVLFTLKKWQPEQHSVRQQKQHLPEKTMSQLLRRRGVICSILSLGLYCTAESLLGTWGASYAVHMFAMEPEAAAQWVSLYYCGIMVGRVVSGFASARLDDDALIRIGVITAVAGTVVLLLPLGTMSLCGLFLIGVGFGPIFPGVLHAVPARFGVDYAADITGFHMGGAYAVGYVLQLLFGLLATSVGFFLTPPALLLLCGGVFVLNGVVLRQLSGEKRTFVER